jgi:hypothetical protein
VFLHVSYACHLLRVFLLIFPVYMRRRTTMYASNELPTYCNCLGIYRGAFLCSYRPIKTGYLPVFKCMSCRYWVHGMLIVMHMTHARAVTGYGLLCTWDVVCLCDYEEGDTHAVWRVECLMEGDRLLARPCCLFSYSDCGRKVSCGFRQSIPSSDCAC